MPRIDPGNDRLKEAMDIVDKAEELRKARVEVDPDTMVDRAQVVITSKGDIHAADPNRQYAPPVVDFEKLGEDMSAEVMSGQELAEHGMQTLRNMANEMNHKHAALADEIQNSKEHTAQLEEQQEAVAKMIESLRTII